LLGILCFLIIIISAISFVPRIRILFLSKKTDISSDTNINKDKDVNINKIDKANNINISSPENKLKNKDSYDAVIKTENTNRSPTNNQKVLSSDR